MMRLTAPIIWFLSFVRYLWQLVGITLILLVFGHYILGGLIELRNLFAEDSVQAAMNKPAAYTKSPVYDGFADRDEFWREQRKAKRGANFQPYYHWRRGEFVGKFTNTSPEGVRRTIKGDIASDASKVFMFGGSTLWGTGSPDKDTIPSKLQAMLGSDYDIYNFGETGYVSAQELNYLLHRLSVGDIPDVVIFYDGVNDGYAGAYSPSIPRDPQKLREERKIKSGTMKDLVSLFMKSNYYEFFFKADGQKNWDKQVEEKIESNSISVVNMYEAHIQQVKALSKEYGFRAVFFWQPNLYSLNRNENEFESAIIDASSPVLMNSQKAVYEAARARLSGRDDEGIYFLGDVFDEIDDPIYIDWMHIGPNGNEIIARSMFEYLNLQ
jgi:lysophospholipase L1-like esterase